MARAAALFARTDQWDMINEQLVDRVQQRNRQTWLTSLNLWEIVYHPEVPRQWRRLSDGKVACFFSLREMMEKVDDYLARSSGSQRSLPQPPKIDEIEFEGQTYVAATALPRVFNKRGTTSQTLRELLQKSGISSVRVRAVSNDQLFFLKAAAAEILDD